MRSLGALVADAVMVVIFVAIGLTQHGLPLTTTTVGLVAWPFAIGLLLGHLAIRAWRRPFAVWPQGVFVWAITIVAAMAIRTLFGAAPQPSFVLVTAVTLGILLLGWRAVASWVTRGERREVIEERDLPGRRTDDGGAADDGADAGRTDEDRTDADRTDADRSDLDRADLDRADLDRADEHRIDGDRIDGDRSSDAARTVR